MKKSLVLVSVLLIVLTFVFSACIFSPEKATQRDMLKYGEFYTDYEYDGIETKFTLTLKKDHTYSLYIKDYEYKGEGERMKTYTGTWSHVLTYEYKYSSPMGTSDFFTEVHTATLGIYLLEGYNVNGRPNYFVYEKSSAQGGIHGTNEQITEEYLEKHRQHNIGLARYEGRVDLSLIKLKAATKFDVSDD